MEGEKKKQKKENRNKDDETKQKKKRKERQGKHAIQTNPSKFDKMLSPDIYLCRLRLKQGNEIQDFMF